MSIVIIGASHAGVSAARTIRKTQPEVQITIIEQKADIAFISSTIAMQAAGVVADLAQTVYITEAGIAELDIDLRLDSRVTNVDAQKQVVHYVHDNTNETLVFDQLIIATGSTTFDLPIQGFNEKRVLPVKTLADGRQIEHLLATPSKVAVLGGGYAGLEISYGLSKNHEVTLIERLPHLGMAYYDAPMIDLLEGHFADDGIQILTNTSVGAITPLENGLHLAGDNLNLDVDYLVVTGNIRPNEALLPLTDDFDTSQLKFNDAPIYVIGDAGVSQSGVNATQRVNIMLAAKAVRQGEFVAYHMLDDTLRYAGDQGSSMSRFGDLIVASVGQTFAATQQQIPDAKLITLSDLANEVIDVLQTENKTTISVVTDAAGKVYGAQIISKSAHIAGLVDVFSLAIQTGVKLPELAFSDFAFSPFLNTPFNPIHLVAQQYLLTVNR